MTVVGDTCWFIDLERGRPSAVQFAAANPALDIRLTPIVLGELAAGVRTEATLYSLLEVYRTLGLDYSAAVKFGECAQLLRAAGCMIGANDLWISSIALARGMPVLTRNPARFNRVPNLIVLTYEGMAVSPTAS